MWPTPTTRTRNDLLRTTSLIRQDSIGASTTISSISKANGILVLEGGAELGIIEGMKITLVQDLKAVGEVQIAKVADTYTIANILPGTDATALVQGSNVSLLR